MSGGTGGGFRVYFFVGVSCRDSATLLSITNRGSIKYSLLLLLTEVLVAWFFVLIVGIRGSKFVIVNGVYISIILSPVVSELVS